MTDLQLAFITLPTGSDGRDEVSINVAEIASYRGHTVFSYTYEQWTMVTLKNGVEHDCKITHRDFEKRVQRAAGMFGRDGVVR